MKLRDSLAENKSIRLQAEAETWQDAVKIGVDLLVAADVVEPRYYQAILDAVEQHGPYFVLAPGLAMPHGRPEEGVKKTGFALVTLKKPLEFNHEDNDPVDILITMAAGLVPMLPLSKKKSGTPMSAPLPKQMSCRFVRLNSTLVFTLVKSFGTLT